MKKFYTVCQNMQTGDIWINEFDIIKETPKTVTYDWCGQPKTKNKDYFNQVHLDSKSDYTGRYQNAYVFVGICESEKEALEKAVPLFMDWYQLLSVGLNTSITEVIGNSNECKEVNKMEYVGN